MADRLFLEDVRFYGQHGTSKEEQAVGAWFSVDVELTADLTPAAISDDLGATIDYRRVARSIVEIGTGQRVNLLERLARLLADDLLRQFPVTEVRVRVRKLTAPLDGVVATPGVELTRRR